MRMFTEGNWCREKSLSFWGAIWSRGQAEELTGLAPGLVGGVEHVNALGLLRAEQQVKKKPADAGAHIQGRQLLGQAALALQGLDDRRPEAVVSEIVCCCNRTAR